MTKRYTVCLNPINILGGKRRESGRKRRKEKGGEEEREGRRGEEEREGRREKRGERGEEREEGKKRKERGRMKGGQKECQVIETVAIKVFHKIICWRLLRKNLYTIQVIENLL